MTPYTIFAYCDSCSEHQKDYEPILLEKNVEVDKISKVIQKDAKPYLEKSHGHHCKKCGNITWQIRIIFSR